MLSHLVARSRRKSIPIHPVTRAGLASWLAGADERTASWVAATGYKGDDGASCLVPDEHGKLARVLVGASGGPWTWAALPAALPPGRYQVAAALDPADATDAALGWALGCYEFCAYRAPRLAPPDLVWPDAADKARVTRLAEAIALARDLINTPAGDMGPAELADAARRLARRHRASCRVVVGDDLLARGFPVIHAVGRAAAQAPRLIDLRWGKPKAPRLTLVGKGVCFDSGGLDIKNAAGMLLMKKDMGGAACVLGLAHAIMDARLPVRLRVLVPAVENAIAGNAFHPLDVLPTRKGLTVEVGNTDAEGRLILCDALAEADSDDPDLIIDMATLTGAARVALGTDLPALYATDDDVADAALAAGDEVGDPMWRMPLYAPYRSQLDSAVADLSNVSSGKLGGSIIAALFLREFISPERRWIHIDTMAWTPDNRPGRPRGGEALGVRALYAMLERRYAG